MSSVARFLDESGAADGDIRTLDALLAQLDDAVAEAERNLEADAELLPLQVSELLASAELPDLGALGAHECSNSFIANDSLHLWIHYFNLWLSFKF